MLHHELNPDLGILTITPEGPLVKEDFEALANIVDPFIESAGKLNGLMIYTKSFPGWQDFAGFTSHIRFVKDHQQHIAKVAAVTDGRILSIMPGIADHFVKAEVKHFDYEEKEKALEWLTSEA